MSSLLHKPQGECNTQEHKKKCVFRSTVLTSLGSRGWVMSGLTAPRSMSFRGWPHIRRRQAAKCFRGRLGQDVDVGVAALEDVAVEDGASVGGWGRCQETSGIATPWGRKRGAPAIPRPGATSGGWGARCRTSGDRGWRTRRSGGCGWRTRAHGGREARW